MADRFVSSQFCDDIRLEVGNKFSLMGCYAGVIHLDPIPSVLPKLCAMVKTYTPISRPFKQLSARIVRGEVVVAEIRFDPEKLGQIPPDAPQDARWNLAVAVFMMAPFAVEAECVLRVEVETEDETLSGGILVIQKPPPSTTVSAH